MNDSDTESGIDVAYGLSDDQAQAINPPVTQATNILADVISKVSDTADSTLISNHLVTQGVSGLKGALDVAEKAIEKELLFKALSFFIPGVLEATLAEDLLLFVVSKIQSPSNPPAQQ